MDDGSEESLPDTVSKKTLAKAHELLGKLNENDNLISSHRTTGGGEALTVKEIVLRMLEFQTFLPHFMNGVCLRAAGVPGDHRPA